MAKVGIVGHEAAKFSTATEAAARVVIRNLLSSGDVVVSGGCHLGGIDAWAVEEARKLGLDCVEHLPRSRSWEGGYKPRNLKIAQDSDRVYSIVVDELPPTYTGMRFGLCYHCGTSDHIKSGGCWTAKEARKLGKVGEVVIVKQVPDA